MDYIEVTKQLIEAGAKQIRIISVTTGKSSTYPADLRVLGNFLKGAAERGIELKLEVTELKRGYQPPLNEQLASYFAIQQEQRDDYNRYCPDCGRTMVIEGKVAYCEYCEG